MTLDDLERLEREATAAPWADAENPREGLVVPGVTRKGDGNPKRCHSRDRPVIAIMDDGACGDECCGDPIFSLHLTPSDRVFIAALRNSAPALLAAARLVEEMNEQTPGWERDYHCEEAWVDDEGNSLTCRDVMVEGSDEMCGPCSVVERWYEYDRARAVMRGLGGGEEKTS